MSKNSCMIVLFCLFSVSVNAQRELILKREAYSVGALLGGGNFQFQSDVFPNRNTKPISPLIGLYVQKHITGRLFLQQELYFSTKNITLSNTESFLDPLKTYRFSSGNLNLNFLMGLKLFKHHSFFNMRIYSGVNPELFVARSVTLNDSKDSKSNTAKGTVNIQAGIGLDLSRLSVDFRGGKGITNISNTYDHLYEYSVMIVLGYKFHIGKRFKEYKTVN